jgi:hypothetical protein
MSDEPTPQVSAAPVPKGSPFATPPVEGLPFKRGSEEDEAIKRVLQKSAARSDEA